MTHTRDDIVERLRAFRANPEQEKRPDALAWDAMQEIERLRSRLRRSAPREVVVEAARKALERVDMGYRYDHGYMDGGRGCRCSYDVWRKPRDDCPKHRVGPPIGDEE